MLGRGPTRLPVQRVLDHRLDIQVVRDDPENEVISRITRLKASRERDRGDGQTFVIAGLLRSDVNTAFNSEIAAPQRSSRTSPRA